MALLTVNYSPDIWQKNLRTFKPIEVNTAADEQKIMLTRPWSPAVYRDNRRTKANFLHADYFGLDYDGGNLKAVMGWLDEQNLRAIVGLTKSYTPEDECFRVLIPWWERVTCPHTHSENIKALVGALPPDEGSWQVNRFFSPCTSIFCVRDTGYPANWTRVEPPPPEPPLVRLRTEPGRIPRWVREILEHGIAGNRNATAYKAARDLWKFGYDAPAIEHLLWESPTDWNTPHRFTREELSNVVRSATKNAN